ncbi:hypothetical protein POM88_041206 [Heracleum sosnowskyi]|uniref:Uncharacterized protein n=1 Tax=Heracleum sosnowskyi TaxID=360622 RepID=A0AAD8HDR8_9APIA|nr:hypothetical protein POM88_041206 [Heracleum sosnowskyi]
MDRSSSEYAQSSGSVSPERSPFFHVGEYPAGNHPTQLSKERVAGLAKEHEIPSGAWHIYMPRADDRLWHNPPMPKGYGSVATGISEVALKCGFRVPMLPLMKKLFAQMGIALGQMDSNGKNGKSKGFYTIARRTNMAEWVETNSNNKGSHDKWCYILSPKIAAVSQWRVVDPTVQVVKPTLSGGEMHEYERLCQFKMDRIPLEDLRDKQWLFALWGYVSSLQTIIERKWAKFRAEQAA